MADPNLPWFIDETTIRKALQSRTSRCGHSRPCREQIDEIRLLIEEAVTDAIVAKDHTIRQYAEALQEQRRLVEDLRRQNQAGGQIAARG
jgi:hypothetical protein